MSCSCMRCMFCAVCLDCMLRCNSVLYRVTIYRRFSFNWTFTFPLFNADSLGVVESVCLYCELWLFAFGLTISSTAHSEYMACYMKLIGMHVIKLRRAHTSGRNRLLAVFFNYVLLFCSMILSELPLCALWQGLYNKMLDWYCVARYIASAARSPCTWY